MHFRGAFVAPGGGGLPRRASPRLTPRSPCRLVAPPRMAPAAPFRPRRWTWTSTIAPNRENHARQPSPRSLASVPGLVLARAGFTAALTVCLSTCCLLCRAVHVLQLGGSERERNGMCVVVAQKCFRWLMLAPCFWIQISGLRELQAELKRASEEAEGAPYVLANHNSPLDSLLFAAVIPPEVGANLRSMVKAVLLDAPLFGSICADVGHFPVFYKRPGEFPVHKELQAVVTERVDEFLGAGGGLFLFPEGTLNRADARRLGSFRRGGFTAPMKYRRAIWGCLNVGCDDVWPVTAPVGGWPARVDLSMIKICDDASRFADSAALAAYAQSRMQAELDRLYELREDCRA